MQLETQEGEWEIGRKKMRGGGEQKEIGRGEGIARYSRG